MSMAAPTLLATLAVLLLIVDISSSQCPPCYFGPPRCLWPKAQWMPQLPCPCFHNGICKCLWDMPRNREKYMCMCNPGFYGDRCQHAGPLITTTTRAPPACWHDGHCLYRGRCIHGVCHCLPMYYGKWCQHLFNGNPCSSDPCLNGGTCRYFWKYHKYVYRCDCPPRLPPYLQPNCATPVSYCTTNPCQRGGSCVVDTRPSGYHCDCVCFVGGKHCEVGIMHLRPPVNPCESSPCKNGGTCCCTGYGYKCDCLPGFKGTNCEVFMYCPPECVQPCPGGECQVIPRAFCVPPCRNGGSCVGTNRCLCPCLVTGTRCQHSAVGIPFSRNPCEPNPCASGQKCCCRGFVANCTP